MLTSFIENGAALHALTQKERFGIETQFTLYLVKVQNYNETIAGCRRVLGEDQYGLMRVVRSRLSALISDADCNCEFKPAVLRLAAGDGSVFREIGVSPRRTQSVIALYPHLFRRALSSVSYPIPVIGPQHVRSLENQCMTNILKHARHYVQKHARFLAMGDSTIDVEDIVNDLRLLALCALRIYYPFRSGLHMENSMRRTITNRGRGYVTAATSANHRTVIQMDDGTSLRREVAWVGDPKTGSPILNHVPGSDPRELVTLRMDVSRIAKDGYGVAREVARFVLDPSRHDRFISWLSRWVPECRQAADVAEAVRMAARPYPFLLSRFLGLPLKDVDAALGALRRVAM